MAPFVGLQFAENCRISVPTDHVATTAARRRGPDDVDAADGQLTHIRSAQFLKVDRMSDGSNITVDMATVWMEVVDFCFLGVAAGSLRFVDAGPTAVGVHARDIAEEHCHGGSIRCAYVHLGGWPFNRSIARAVVEVECEIGESGYAFVDGLPTTPTN